MAGPIMTGSHPKALWPGIKAWFGVGYGELAEEYRDIFSVESSEQAFEEDVQLTGFGLMPVKAEGKSTTYQGQVQGYVARYTHIAYSLGYIVTFEEQLNNLYEKVSKSRAKALGFSKRQTIEVVGAGVYNRAFNTSYTGGDGKALCVTDHPSGAGNQSNALNPAADISEVALEDMCIMVMTAKDNKGLQIKLLAQSLHVPPALWFEANRILKSTLQNDSANNALNVLKSTSAIPGGIKVNHFFTDTDAFFIRTNAPEGMKAYKRHSYDLKQDNDFDTDNLKAKTYYYGSFGWSDWRGLVGSAGA